MARASLPPPYIVIECVAAGASPRDSKVGEFMSGELICAMPDDRFFRAATLGFTYREDRHDLDRRSDV